MELQSADRREIGYRLCASFAAFSGFMLALSGWSAFFSPSDPASAAPVEGSGQIVVPDTSTPLLSGGSSTPFTIKLPADAACTGDTQTGQYVVQSYMVAGSIDPSTLTWSGSGPANKATGVGFRQALFDVTSSPYSNKPTDVASGGGAGLVLALPNFNFAVWTPNGAEKVPPGDYNIGIACTKGPAGPTQLDKFWNVSLTFAADANDQPAGITWTVTADPGGTTTTTTGDGTTTTTTTGDGSTTTTTTGDGSTTTTAGDGSTTTTAGGGTTSTSAGGGGGTTATTSFSGGNPSGPSVSSTVGQLPYTGNSPWSLVVWAALLLVFGRMAILLGRKPKVKTPGG